MNNPKLTQVPLDQIYIDPDLIRGGFSEEVMLENFERIQRELSEPRKPFIMDVSRDMRKSRFNDDLAGYTWPTIYSLMKKVHKAYKKKRHDDFALYAQELIESAAVIYWQVIESENCEAINIDYGGGAILFDGDTPIAKIDYQPTTLYYNEYPLPKAVEPLAAIERFIRTGEIESKWCSNVEFDPNHTVVLGSRYSKEDYDGYSDSAILEFVDRSNMSDKEREMNRFVGNAFDAVLEQMKEHSLIIGSLAFDMIGDRFLMRDAVDEISKERSLNIAGAIEGDVVGIAVTRHDVVPSVLARCAQTPLDALDDNDLVTSLRQTLLSALHSGEQPVEGGDEDEDEDGDDELTQIL